MIIKYIRYAISFSIFLSSGAGFLAVANNISVEETASTVKQVGNVENAPIHGQVLYPDPLSMPPHALLTIQLIDMTTLDTSAQILAQSQQTIIDNNAIAFTLPLSIKDLQDGHVYALQAQISVGEELWFVNPQPLPLVLTRNSYRIRLEKVAQAMNIQPIKSSLKGREWLALRIEGQSIIEPHPSLKFEDLDSNSLIEEGEEASNSQPLVDFKRYKVTGTGGCNHYFSTALIDEKAQHLQFSPIGMTFMACIDAIQSQENHFVDMMSRVAGYRLEEGERLFLISKDGQTIAHFGTGL